MNKDINFISFTNLNELLEEHKKITYPYKRYEFDSTSYTLLLCDINNILKENANLKQALNEIRKIIYKNRKHYKIYSTEIEDWMYIKDKFILQIIDKVLGDEK